MSVLVLHDRYDRDRCVREYRTVQPPRAACFLEPEAAALQSRDHLLVVAERGQISVWDIRVRLGVAAMARLSTPSRSLSLSLSQR